MNPAAPNLGLIGRIARAVSVLLLTYWGAFALACPALTIDAQMYNLARIELALRDGLFDNRFFTSVFHVLYPWAFDAVHLPFLLLGWGFALPSFLCLAGTCLAIHQMIRAHFGSDAAWTAVLALLALPCLVYQATATKNDLALLFAGAVWTYARWRWRRENDDRHLIWMVLAIGFMFGAKTTGIMPAAALALWTLWELRHRRTLLTRTLVGLAAAGLSFGSLETYVENARQYGHPLGPSALLRRASNTGGVKGTAANLIRHTAGAIYLGQTDFSGAPSPSSWFSDATRRLLAATGLTDAGADRHSPDKNLYLHQSGLEELSGYGPVGTLAMLAMLSGAVSWKSRRHAWWWLAVAGLLGLLLISSTIGYTPWAKRYLLPWFALGTLSVVCLLWGSNTPWHAGLRWGFLVLAAFSALAAPFWSFNRGPRALLDAFRDRERLETSAYPVVGLVRESLRRLHHADPAGRIFIVTHDESVLLPLLTDRALAVLPVTRAGFQDLLDQGFVKAGDLAVFESPVALATLILLETVTAPNVFSFRDTRSQYIYRFTPPAPPNPRP